MARNGYIRYSRLLVRGSRTILYDSLVGTVKDSYLLQLSFALYTFGSRLAGVTAADLTKLAPADFGTNLRRRGAPGGVCQHPCGGKPAPDSCRFTTSRPPRPWHLHDVAGRKSPSTKRKSVPARQLWVLEPENFPLSLRARRWCCLCFQDCRFAFSAQVWSYCQNLKQTYLRKPP